MQGDDEAVASFDPTTPEATVQEPVAGAPSDNTTLTEVLNGMDALGFGTAFIALDGGLMECTACRTVSPTTEFVVESSRRLEGASDPDDLSSVIACTCPACGIGGNLILGYGVNATALDADTSAALRGTPARTSPS